MCVIETVRSSFLPHASTYLVAAYVLLFLVYCVYLYIYNIYILTFRVVHFFIVDSKQLIKYKMGNCN